jgi:hypothetical protein
MIIEFISGLVMGGIPSVAMYIMLQRDAFAYKFLGGHEAAIIDGGELISQPLLKDEKVDLKSLSAAIIRNAELNPEDWQVYSEGAAFWDNGKRAHYYGARNKKADIFVRRNHLFYSMKNDIWLNEMKINENVYNTIVKGVEKAKEQANIRKLMNKMNNIQTLISSSREEQRLLPHAPPTRTMREDGKPIKKEAVGKTVDPFAETWNDQIYKIGKARASMDSASIQSRLDKSRSVPEPW